jgi:hypothetical protein
LSLVRIVSEDRVLMLARVVLGVEVDRLHDRVQILPFSSNAVIGPFLLDRSVLIVLVGPFARHNRHGLIHDQIALSDL